MAADVAAEETIETLRAAFEQRIRLALTWMPAHEALQLADALCCAQIEALAGSRVLYRALPQVDGAAVKEDWRRGLSVTEIMKRHGISRSGAYKHHPSRDVRRGGQK